MAIKSTRDFAGQSADSTVQRAAAEHSAIESELIGARQRMVSTASGHRPRGRAGRQFLVEVGGSGVGGMVLFVQGGGADEFGICLPAVAD